MERSRWPLAGTLAGALVGCLIVGGLLASGALVVPRHRDDRDASADFLKAWERSRTGTFIVESDFRRRLGDGRTLFSASKLVQQRPNRIIRQFGGIDGEVNGHPIICSTDQGGNFSCFAGTATTVGFDESVARELDTFRSYFAAVGTPLTPHAAGTSLTTGPQGTGTTSAGPPPAGTEPSASQPPGSERPNSERPISEPTGSQPGGAPTSGTQPTGTKAPGTQPPGTQPAVAPPSGAQPSGTQPSGMQPRGPGGAADAPAADGGPGTTVPLVALGLYRVGYGDDAGCYELFQRIPYPDAPYGTYAKLCFEQDTGAMVLLERHLANDVVETLQAFRTSVAVTPTDFETSADDSYKLRMDLGGFPEPVTSPVGSGTTVPAAPGASDLAAKTNVELLDAGSAAVLQHTDDKAYVAEVVRRMRAGTLSINSPDWIEGGRVRSLLAPVVYELLGTGIYYGPTS